MKLDKLGFDLTRDEKATLNMKKSIVEGRDSSMHIATKEAAEDAAAASKEPKAAPAFVQVDK